MTYYGNDLVGSSDYYINQPQHFQINTRGDQISGSYELDHWGNEKMFINSMRNGQTRIFGNNGVYNVW